MTQEPTVILACTCDAERTLLKSALSAAGLSIHEVNGANATVSLADSLGSGVIILDTLFWETGAQNTLVALKRHPVIQHLPVIMFGQPQSPEAVNTALQAGAAAWVERQGFDLPAFVAKVRSFVEPAAGSVSVPCGPAFASAAVPPPPTLEKLTEAIVRQKVAAENVQTAFDFSVTDAITTACPKGDGLDHIAEIVEHDPLLAMTVMSWARQTSWDGSSRIGCTRDAITKLGTREFYRRVESVKPLRFNNASIWDPGFFWFHGIATARIAELLAKHLDLCPPGEATAAGLMHDFGFYVLAHHFPKHFGLLFTADSTASCLSPSWEERLIGSHHGQIGAWALAELGISPVLQEAVAAHHLPDADRQSLTRLSQVLAWIIQGAQQLASVLYPGDPPLTPLSPISSTLQTALRHSKLSWDRLLDVARCTVADLLTETIYLMPQSSSRSYYHKRKPLERVLYYAPGVRDCDIVKMFLVIRSNQITELKGLSDESSAPPVPLVVNLMELVDPGAHVEAISSLISAGWLKNRKAAILFNLPPTDAYKRLVPANCQMIGLGTRPLSWLRWLAEPLPQAAAAPRPAPVSGVRQAPSPTPRGVPNERVGV